jgi:hypothetical protein
MTMSGSGQLCCCRGAPPPPRPAFSSSLTSSCRWWRMKQGRGSAQRFVLSRKVLAPWSLSLAGDLSVFYLSVCPWQSFCLSVRPTVCPSVHVHPHFAG